MHESETVFDALKTRDTTMKYDKKYKLATIVIRVTVQYVQFTHANRDKN